MKLHVVVYTSEFDRSRLCLDSAWSEAVVMADPDVARSRVRMALERPGVLTAGVAIVDVPDAVIRPYLSAAAQGGTPPTVQAVVDTIDGG